MKAQIVSFHCVLRDKLGRVISSTFNRDVITLDRRTGQQMLKGLAEGLCNLKNGEKRRIALTAEQAYGFYDPSLVMDVERKSLSRGTHLKVGDTIIGQSAAGTSLVFRVTAADPKRVMLDGNHPLAGQDLFFDIEMTEAREAREEEVAEPDLPFPVPRHQSTYLH